MNEAATVIPEARPSIPPPALKDCVSLITASDASLPSSPGKKGELALSMMVSEYRFLFCYSATFSLSSTTIFLIICIALCLMPSGVLLSYGHRPSKTFEIAVGEQDE